MPALPAVPKVVRCDFHFSESTDPNIQIREFFQYAGTLSTADAVTWLGNMVAAMHTFVSGNISNQVSLVLSELTDLSSNTSPQVLNSSGQVGGAVAAAVPAGVAMVLSKHIQRRYRGGHPRVYLPGLENSGLASPGHWDPAYAGGVAGAYITFLNACTAVTNPAAIGAITHVNISYFSGFTNHTFPSGRVKPIPTPRATPLIDTITNVTANLVPGSQRRRNEQP